MFNKIMEKVIKDHIKEREDLFGRFKGLKVQRIKFVKTVETSFEGIDGENSIMTKYMVTCSFKAPKYENNMVDFEVNFYDNCPEGKDGVGVYFNGTH
jgi:hypothetical protein